MGEEPPPAHAQSGVRNHVRPHHLAYMALGIKTAGVRLRHWLVRRSPYHSLAILAVPLAFAEPAKLVAVAVFGGGHWILGAVILILAYTLSICVIDRLFRIMKPTLLELRWFAKSWRWFNDARVKMIAPFLK